MLAWLVKGVAAWRDRHVWSTLRPAEPTLPTAYVRMVGIERHVAGSMLVRHGVPVVALPRGFGKTTAARIVAHQAWRDGWFSGVAYVSVPPGSTACVSELIRSHMGVDDVGRAMSRLTNNGRDPPILVIIDDADRLTTTPHDAQLLCQGDLVGLAGQSLATKEFMIAMLFDSLQAAHQVGQWNGGSKIEMHRPFDADGVLPTEAELEELVKRQALEDPAAAALLAALARRSRSVGLVADVAAELGGAVDPTERAACLERAVERSRVDARAAADWTVGVNEWLRPETPLDRQLVMVRKWQAEARARLDRRG